jgi:hypothetical protein
MKTVIDLNGPDGNAFHLLAVAQRICRKRHVSFKPIQKEMMASDFDHLVETFARHFGKLVTLKPKA